MRVGFQWSYYVCGSGMNNSREELPFKSLPAIVAVARAAIIFFPTLDKSLHIQPIYDNKLDVVVNPY